MTSSERSISRRLFDLSVPVIGLNVLSVLALAVDVAMCGRLPNADHVLTALSFATQVVFLLMVVMMGLTVGTVAIISRAYGAGDHARVNHVLLQSTMLTVLVGLGVGVVGNLLAEPILRALGAEGPAVHAGLRYLRPLLGATVFYYLTILYGGVLRGVGNTRLPFMVALLSNLLNIAINYCLILGNFGLPALGELGAAIGTVVSYAVNAGVMLLLLRRGVVPNLRPPLRPRALDRALAATLYRIGAPAAADMLILNIAFLTLVGMLGRMDAAAVAAHGIGLRIQALAFVPGLGVSQATAAMVGQALGAGRIDHAVQVVRSSIFLCVAIMTTLGFAIILAAHPIVRVFDVAAGTPLEAYSVQWMHLLGYGMPVVGMHISFVGLLQGSGSTNTSLGINLIGTVLIQVPLAAVLGISLDLGPFGVWLSFPLSFIAKAGLGALAYRSRRWAKVGAEA